MTGADAPEELAGLLKRLRRNRGLTQQALAEKAQVSPGLISLVEMGQRGLGDDSAYGVAAALGLSGPDRDRLYQAASLYRETHSTRTVTWARMAALVESLTTEVATLRGRVEALEAHHSTDGAEHPGAGPGRPPRR